MLQKDPDSKGPLVPLSSYPQFEETLALDFCLGRGVCCAELGYGKAPSLREAVALRRSVLWANACFSSAAHRKSDLTEGTWAVVLVSNIFFFSLTDPFSLNWFVTLGNKSHLLSEFFTEQFGRGRKTPGQTLSGNRNC